MKRMARCRCDVCRGDRLGNLLLLALGAICVLLGGYFR